MKTELYQPGDRVEIIGVSPEDAHFYKERALIGAQAIVSHPTNYRDRGDGYISIDLNLPFPILGSSFFVFFRVKIRKLK